MPAFHSIGEYAIAEFGAFAAVAGVRNPGPYLLAQREIYDDWEGIFGFELQGGIDFMPDTAIREEPEGVDLTEQPEPTDATAVFTEVLPYVYTSSE